MATVVDADTHISEPAAMWELMEPDLYLRRPVVVSVPTNTWYGDFNAMWLIDGNIFPKPMGKGSFRLVTPSAAAGQARRTDIDQTCRELTDPEPRLREMDKLQVDIQVVYPTLFLVYLTDDPDLEIALCRAYNRFLANAYANSGGRIRWTAIPPLRSMPAAVSELRWAKEHGAVGVFFRGVERDKTLDEAYFYPIYEEAAGLGMPICIHTGAGCPAWTAIFNTETNTSFPHLRILPLIAFNDLLVNDIPRKFPKLKFGFIEAGSSWVPYLFHTLRRRLRDGGKGYGPKLFEDNRIWVACETDEDLPYLLKYVGEDHLVIGSDYGHNDPSEEPRLVETMRNYEGLPGRVVDKILGENAKELYGL
ncbi:MAG TPA: amidohydrolase family protein [Chloroflexota bacterium]|nr:amidohydrolase family protein [Chloroflexota bacterium]